MKTFFANNKKKVLSIKPNSNKVEILNGLILMKSIGKECLTIYTKKNISNFCFNIYNTPEIIFKENNPIKIEVNKYLKLNLDQKDYPDSNIKYSSNHPQIVKVDDNGKIFGIRPGNAIISANGLDNKSTQINVIVTTKEGLLKNHNLDIYNVEKYKNIMIVAHPDDEILWGGANLLRDRYFIICLTNGNNLERSNDFKEILKFTNNSGIILDYPDLEDGIINDWSEVRYGIFKDLSKILNYKHWNKIVTHGPDGTTGHIHHKQICKYVTEISKNSNMYKNLYYFGKFYKRNKIPNYLSKIADKELEYKKKEVEIYKSVKKTIYQLWFHMLPYENWILASNWKES